MKFAEVLDALLDLRYQGALLRSRAVRTGLLVVSIGLVGYQQGALLLSTAGPDPRYRNVLNLGASYQRYFAFYYYFGGFPVNLDRQNTATRADAEATLQKLGAGLRSDLAVYNRASIFLFYPDAWWKGRPDTAEMRTGLALWFTAGLIGIVLAFTYLRMPLLGLGVALLCGSDPFQVWEIYHQGSSTIFGTVIASGLVATSIFLVVTARRGPPLRALMLLVALGGTACAFQYEIRLEGVGGFLGGIAALLFFAPMPPGRRLACLGVFLTFFLWTTAGISSYFDRSFRAADAVVGRYGGTPGGATNPYYSTPWWALWSGLGDFDEKYGFLADDRAGLSYYYGSDRSVNSEVAMRANYLGLAAQDPAWFADILARRMRRVLVENTPYRLTFGSRHWDLPLPPPAVTGLGVVLLVISLFVQGRAKLPLFVLPLSIGLVSIGQLADYGLQFYCVAHLFLVAYVICVALDGLLLLMFRGRALTLQTPPASSMTLG